MKGKISKYFTYRGYGFISTDEEDDDIFFHVSNFPSNALPSQGQALEFSIVKSPKGLEAKDIKVVDREIIQEPEKLDNTSSESNLDQLNGVGPKYKTLLKEAHVKTFEELSNYSPEVLLANILAVNEEKQITKRPPTLDQVTEWIDHASENILDTS
jgi:CspA family cold shock protein